VKKFSNFSFLRFSCEETGFRVFFTRKFLHTRIPLPVFSSHENCVSRFFFTRKCRCLFFLHTRIPLPVFSSHGNCVSRFFFTRKCRCLFFLHTRIPLPVSSHENPVARFFTRKCRCLFFLHTRIPLPVSSHENSVARFFTRESRYPFLHGFSLESPWGLWSVSRGATTQSPTTIAPRRHLWLALFSVEGRPRFVLESSLQWHRACLIYDWLMTNSRCVRERFVTSVC